MLSADKCSGNDKMFKASWDEVKQDTLNEPLSKHTANHILL